LNYAGTYLPYNVTSQNKSIIYIFLYFADRAFYYNASK